MRSVALPVGGATPVVQIALSDVVLKGLERGNCPAAEVLVGRADAGVEHVDVHTVAPPSVPVRAHLLDPPGVLVRSPASVPPLQQGVTVGPRHAQVEALLL